MTAIPDMKFVLQSRFRVQSLRQTAAVCAVLALVYAAPLAAQQTRSSAASARSASTSQQGSAGFRAEEEFFNSRLLELRTQYLEGASWADLGDRCNPGALRIFPDASTPAERDSITQLIMRIEQTVVGRGAGESIDTPSGRALMRVIVGWEAGIDRPYWDSDEKDKKAAIATGLTGEYPDPNGPGCLTAIEDDTVTFVIPGITDMEFPRSPKVRVKAYLGSDALSNARNEFASVNLNRAGSELQFIFISPAIIWRDWAVVTVTRPIEERGVVVGSRNNGGVVYLMRKTAGEWRLLAIMRTWG